jgi:hypothetical protein
VLAIVGLGHASIMRWSWYARAVPDDKLRPPRRQTPSTAEREAIIATLSDHFAQGEIDIETFEERVSVAHRATSPADLVALTADLSALPPSAPIAPPVALAHDSPETGEAVAVFGGTQRVGKWRVPRRFRMVAVFGGIEIDLREAELPDGPFQMDVRATFAGVHIIVPPALAVEVHGSAIFGGFQHMDRVPPTPDPKLPVLHIQGIAVFGGVSIETRLPGESRLGARRRSRKEMRVARRLRRLDK